MGPQTNSSRFRQSSDSPRPSDSLAQGLPALGIVPFSCLSYIPLNYIHSYLYTCLYNVARFPSFVTLLCRTGPRTNSGCFGQSSDSPWPSDLLAQGLPALGIVLFSCLSYLPLNYIRSCLYTHLYDVARFPSLYIDLAPLPHSLPSNIIFISSSLEDVLSSPMDHTPIRSIPATGLQPSAVGSPLQGSG